jgi:uncharacterized membrane protein YqjE
MNMPFSDRSLADVFQDIVRNVQEIVRAEIKLAKAEFRQEGAKAASTAKWLGLGAVSALFTMLFLLLTIVDALAQVMPHWAASLAVAAALALVATITLTTGLKRLKQSRPVPERTIESLKENVQWAKQSSR